MPTPPTSKFEIYKDAAGKFRWRLRVPNGEIIAFSEAYETKEGCLKAIEIVRINIPKAESVDMLR